MRDAELWAQIRDTPIAMADSRQDLMQTIGREYPLSHARRAIALAEYRRFLYLIAISPEPLAPSPIIAAIRARHAQDPLPFPYWRRLVGHKGRASSNLATDPAYQRTLDLYRQEFGVEPMASVWPSVRRLKAFFRSFFIIGGGAFVAVLGEWLEASWLTGLGLAALSLAILWGMWIAPWGMIRYGD